ncbi:MAG: hypothetical protein RIE08_12350 [Acidimicrobiales bacterium]
MSRRLACMWVVVALGAGLVIAPFAFEMFDRAPGGGEMIDEFAPYMTVDEVAKFRGYLDEIDAAEAESVDGLRSDLERWEALDAAEQRENLAALVTFNETWPAIDDDMTDLVDRMERNLDNYDAVVALPPFKMFPWFFLAPGVLLIGTAGVVLIRRRHDSATRLLVATIGVVGLGLVAAPFAFQMFERAPLGAEMIDDFGPMMTPERVSGVQGHFVTMGAAEGQLRVVALPLAEEAGGIDAAQRYPSIVQMSQDWPTIVNDFSPMIATMNDNITEFEGVEALPPFSLFPWFFVIPGVVTVILASVALAPRDNHVDMSPSGPAIPASTAEGSEPRSSEIADSGAPSMAGGGTPARGTPDRR